MRGSGIDDDDAAQAIDDQQLAVADQRPGVPGRARPESPCCGREWRYASGAADIGDERGEAVFLEGDGVGRRQIVGDDDQAFFLDPWRSPAPPGPDARAVP